MAIETIQYTAKEGDRWDAIADYAYGDPYGYPRIINNNPTYRNTVVFAGGEILQLPVIAVAEDELIGDELLPPWRRNG